jgi:hypothetical protein
MFIDRELNVRKLSAPEIKFNTPTDIGSTIVAKDISGNIAYAQPTSAEGLINVAGEMEVLLRFRSLLENWLSPKTIMECVRLQINVKSNTELDSANINVQLSLPTIADSYCIISDVTSVRENFSLLNQGHILALSAIGLDGAGDKLPFPQGGNYIKDYPLVFGPGGNTEVWDENGWVDDSVIAPGTIELAKGLHDYELAWIVNTHSSDSFNEPFVDYVRGGGGPWSETSYNTGTTDLGQTSGFKVGWKIRGTWTYEYAGNISTGSSEFIVMAIDEPPVSRNLPLLTEINVTTTVANGAIDISVSAPVSDIDYTFDLNMMVTYFSPSPTFFIGQKNNG